MKFLVITELFLPTKGGTAVWFAEVYRRLGGKGIHIITSSVSGSGPVDAEHPNTIHRLNLHRIPWLRPESLAIYFRLLIRALRLAMTQHFVAIHAGRVLPEGLVAWLVARITFRPVLIYAHGEELTGWGDGWKFKTMRFLLRHVNTVIANSDFTYNELINMGVRSDRIVLISPGVDITRFKPGLPHEDLREKIGLQPHQKLVLSVGRLQRRKGFDMVIKSLSSLVERGIDAHYALIGIGEDWDYLNDLAAQQNVLDRIHFLGHVSPDDLPRWLNSCDVFVMPNREINGDTEGFGMVFIEANACGKPVVAGIAGGTGSAVIDGVTGYRIDGTRIEQIVDALARLLTNTELAATIGKQAYERAKDKFSWDSIAERTRQLDYGENK